MTDQRTRRKGAAAPAREPVAVTGVAAGALGTAANLDETQVFSTEDLRRHAAEAQSMDAQAALASTAPAAPMAVATPERAAPAPPPLAPAAPAPAAIRRARSRGHLGSSRTGARSSGRRGPCDSRRGTGARRLGSLRGSRRSACDRACRARRPGIHHHPRRWFQRIRRRVSPGVLADRSARDKRSRWRQGERQGPRQGQGRRAARTTRSPRAPTELSRLDLGI